MLFEATVAFNSIFKMPNTASPYLGMVLGDGANDWCFGFVMIENSSHQSINSP
jgi:hypothetical protein